MTDTPADGQQPPLIVADRICIDCQLQRDEPELSAEHIGYCMHHTPEYWQERHGYVRAWGDAAVMQWPQMEILRKRTESGVEYLILAPATGIRRPVKLYMSVQSWGTF